MTTGTRLRLPVSTRHAFALALDLAVRRDPFHSVVVPLILRTPWILALAVLPPIGESERPEQVAWLRLVALAGDLILLSVIGAMLRMRARSVFNTPPEVAPAPALECYGAGLRRVPWLVLTEIVRNASVGVAALFLVLPGVFLGFRLALATEAVVLSDRNLTGAFAHSFRVTQGRFERWLEMVVASVLVVLSILFAGALAMMLARGTGLDDSVPLVTWILVTGITPVIQYAWAFFYLRLVEVDGPGVEVEPAYAEVPAGTPPPLSLVPPEGRREGGREA